jgi:hypothetical protein
MDSSRDVKWVAVVYNDGDKIDHRVFKGSEEVVLIEASRWVKKKWGEKADWSLHKVSEHL